MSDTTLGLLFLLIAGIMNASFTLPMKFTRTWAWENTWLAWSLFALVLFASPRDLPDGPAARQRLSRRWNWADSLGGRIWIGLGNRASIFRARCGIHRHRTYIFDCLRDFCRGR